MKKMKLNIQLFAVTATTTFNEPALTDANITNNNSTLKITISFSANNNVTWFSSKKLWCNCNGVAQSKTVSLSKGGSVTETFTFNNIGHNADGTKSVNWSWDITTGTSVIGTLERSGSRTLQTIPRASQPSLVTWPDTTYDITMGNQITVHMNRVSTSFTHSVYYNFGSLTNQLIATNVTDNCLWTPPLTMANQIPSSTSGTGSVLVKTYNGTTLVGEKSVSFRANIPSSVVPSASFGSPSEAGDTPSSWGVYVKSKSKVRLTLTGSGAYGSNITNYKITGNGYTYTTSTIVSNYLTSSGSISFSGLVTDSRGRQKSATAVTISVEDYTNPTISTAQVQRCDIDGNIDSNGEYCYISYGASISSCANHNKENAHYKVGYRVHNTGSYTDIPLTSNVNSYSASGMLYTDGIYEADRGSGTKVQFSNLATYDIQFYVDDTFNTNGITSLKSLDTGFDLMNFNASGKAMAIGKVSEAGDNEELFEVGVPTKIDDDTTIDGYLRVKNNGNTLIIGDQNTYYTHFYNTEDKAFHFNKNVRVQGNVYGGTGYNRQLAYKDETMPLVTLTLNNEWIMGYKASGDNLSVILPFTNPDKKTATVNITSAEIYSGGWQPITHGGTTVFQTFIKLGFSTSASVTNGNVYLVRITGTISI